MLSLLRFRPNIGSVDFRSPISTYRGEGVARDRQLEVPLAFAKGKFKKKLEVETFLNGPPRFAKQKNEVLRYLQPGWRLNLAYR